MPEKVKTTRTHIQTHKDRLSWAMKSAKGQTAGLSVCARDYVCLCVCVCVCVCVCACLAAELFMWLTLEQIKGDASFLGMCAPANRPHHHLTPPSTIHIHRPSIIEHNKNQQIRRQRLMWTDKSRKWIWKPPPALCHISSHSVADKQDASPFCLTAPFVVFSLSPSPTSI